MSNYCTNMIKKFNGDVYCKYYKKKITNECRLCELKEFAFKEQKKLRQRTSKQAKKEKARFTILKGLSQEFCNECGKYTNLETNELFTGRNRSNSIKHGACNYLCHSCNIEYSNNKAVRDKWQQLYKEEFLKDHTEEEFIAIFKMSYKK